MTNEVSLRQIHENDLPVFFEQQLDPDARRMAAFPARLHDEFMAHWKKVMAEGAAIVRTIIFQGNVAGNIVSWEVHGERRLGYWLGKEYWGKGIASAALAQFLEQVRARPVHARVAKHNTASIRVLQKCGFAICGEDKFAGCGGEQGEEFILILEANEQIEAE